MVRFFLLVLICGVVAGPAWSGGLEDKKAGDKAHEAGKFDLSIHYYTRAIRSGDLPQRELAFAYYARGLTYSRIKNPDSAMEDYNQAIDLNPEFVSAWSSRCYQKRARGQLDEALKDCNQALRLAPNHGPSMGVRAQIWEVKGMYDEALKDYTHSLRLAPKNWALHYNLANYHHRRGDRSNARPSYVKAYERAPQWVKENPRWSGKFKEYGIAP